MTFRVKVLSEIKDMAACSYICPSKTTDLIYLIQKIFFTSLGVEKQQEVHSSMYYAQC